MEKPKIQFDNQTHTSPQAAIDAMNWLPWPRKPTSAAPKGGYHAPRGRASRLAGGKSIRGRKKNNY